MDKFGKLKKVIYLDKPAFHLADPNNPVEYKTRPAPPLPESPKPAQAPQQAQEQMPTAQSRPPMPRRQMASSISKQMDPSSAVKEDEFPQAEYNVDSVNGAIRDALDFSNADESLDFLDSISKEDYTPEEYEDITETVLRQLARTGAIR